MPLPIVKNREQIHDRVIEMRAFARDDGLYDIDAHLTDRKPFDFPRLEGPGPTPAGQPLHDLWIRLTVDSELVVRSVQASSDATPFALCRQAESTLALIIGQQIAPGWSMRMKKLLAGSASCTHLMEMLIPMATTALQGIRGLRRKGLHDVTPSDVTPRLDSCYAYARDKSVIQSYWPEHYRPAPSK